MNTTLTYYSIADTKMKLEVIEKATFNLKPLFDDDIATNWDDEEEIIKNFMVYIKSYPDFFSEYNEN
jgi:hypothetical protein